MSVVFSTPAELALTARARTGSRNVLAPVALGMWVEAGLEMGPEALGERAVHVALVVNPALEALLLRLGAQKRSRRRFTYEPRTPRDLAQLLAGLPLRSCFAEEDAADLEWTWLAEIPRTLVVRRLSEQLRQLPHAHQAMRGIAARLGASSATGAGVLLLQVRRGRLELRVGLESLPVEDPRGGSPRDLADLGGLGLYSGARRRLRLTYQQAELLAGELAGRGLPLVDLSSDGQLVRLQLLAEKSAFADRVPGAPGLTSLRVGSAYRQPALAGTHAALDGVVALRAAASRARGVLPPVEHPAVVEAAAMAAARPLAIPGLKEYQNEFCARYAVTERGMVNALDPGMGKTVCAAAALRVRAAQHSGGWLGVIALPASVMGQWRLELARFFPEAEVCILDRRSAPAALRACARLRAAGRAVVVLCGFETLTAELERLRRLTPDDLVCDEAAFLRGSSQRARALWALRRSATRGLALTGTPVERSLDDLAALVSWARGEPGLFSGAPLQQRVAAGGHAAEVLGPVVFRRSREELEELPELRTLCSSVELSDAEAELVTRVLRRLRSRWEEMERLRCALRSTHGPARGEVRGALTRLQGQVLADAALARAVACDPIAALEESVLEVPCRLRRRIEQGEPSKRLYAAATVEEALGAGSRVLVFADFAPAARALTRHLQGAGVRARALTAQRSPAARASDARAFRG